MTMPRDAMLTRATSVLTRVDAWVGSAAGKPRVVSKDDMRKTPVVNIAERASSTAKQINTTKI